VRALAATLNPASLHGSTAGGSSPVPLTGLALAIEIVSRVREGNHRFDIRLDPPELGRIDVRLDVDRLGVTSTRLTVDRPETLALLQREASGLERALQSAGLKTDEGGLEFSLRYQAQDGAADRRPESMMEPRPDLLVIEDHEPVGNGLDHYGWAARARGGVDIRV
jgi:chemotaxis protein MotD